VKATKVFSVERIVELKSGMTCRLCMDLFDVGKGKAKGLFLHRFRFSWIFFEIENPMHRVLVDCHEPFGVHVHYDDGPHQPVECETLDDVREIFAAAIKKHFNEDLEV
jgi:hypothetical protein